MLTPEMETAARRLADEICARTRGADHEDTQVATPGWKSHARAKKYRDQDRARINGMTIALTYLLGRPNDMQLAQHFIRNDPDWRSML